MLHAIRQIENRFPGTKGRIIPKIIVPLVLVASAAAVVAGLVVLMS